ncbi:MAG: hypothetical protein F6K40_26265 [Okeania sp. SIO3I5]|uniref:hypothetical protein n=1 Tax=Okeania sp. SIO3I5 TaxID=2607805 RepID=UPI0013B99E2D|nr:hypothetical protein [Okeania sp. SIO3I5]NEQ39570.1 hypothetical protein [Okeania sp. SIO3I5]
MSDSIHGNAVIGDTHANDIFSAYPSGIPGLPICSSQLDDEVEKLINEDNYDRIYISPSYPLAGLKKITEIRSKYANPEESISFEKKDNGFYSKVDWRKFIKDEKETLLLWNYWKDRLKYLYGLSEKIWILPIALYWYEMKIPENIPKIYADIVKEFARCVDVAAILKGNRFHHRNKYGQLTNQGIVLISQAIKTPETTS